MSCSTRGHAVRRARLSRAQIWRICVRSRTRLAQQEAACLAEA
jgi:hypothetical protein